MRALMVMVAPPGVEVGPRRLDAVAAAARVRRGAVAATTAPFRTGNRHYTKLATARR